LSLNWALMTELEPENREIDVAFRSIKSTFETGDVRKMYDIATLYPTKIIKALGLNHGRYINKLAKPETFDISEIIRFSRLIGVDHQKVLEVILKEAIPNVAEKEKTKKAASKKPTPKPPASKQPAPKKTAVKAVVKKKAAGKGGKK
jgi:hypothetical protein